MNLKISTYFKEKNQFFIALTSLASCALVAWGQPSRSSICGMVAAFCGFALFWKGLLQINSRKKAFYLSWMWFMAVQAVQLSWMTATEYQGNYIYIVYLFFIAIMGAQFACLNFFLHKDKSLSIQKIFFLASFWVLMEWGRLFILSGFPFNPVGLALSCSLYGRQWAAIGGVYLLSFWVMFTNLLFLKSLTFFKNKKNWAFLAFIALLPYLYGYIQVERESAKMNAHLGYLNALLVQTGLSPEKKTGMNGFDKMIPPIQQWGAIFNYLAPYKNRPIDLIVLPETSVPFADQTLLYPLDQVEEVVRYFYGESGLKVLKLEEEKREIVDNLFLSQFLADYFKAQVIVSFEYLVDSSKENYTAYSSAFSLRPGHKPEKYHKRILLPIVEYIPFKWCEDLARKYHIYGWYQRGVEPKVFSGDLAVAPSICIEELFGHLIRKNRRLGGELFVNMTNDVWFPNSKLPKQHFDHGLLRAVENGVPMLRSCNTGVTVAVDALGREVANFNTPLKNSQWKQGALFVTLSKYQYKTFYLLVGDFFIISLSLTGFLSHFLFGLRRNTSLKLAHFLLKK